MYDRFCTEMSGSGFKNNAHKQLKEIEKSGGDLSEFQKSLHGTIDQQEDWRTNITFGQEMGNGNRVFLTLLSFLHVQDKCITASSRHFVTTDEEVRAALAERKEFCRDVHNANQSLAPERK